MSSQQTLPTQLSRWEQLPGQVVREVVPGASAFGLVFDGGHATLRARDEGMTLVVERIEGESTTSVVEDWQAYVGKAIARVTVPYFAPGHSEKSRVEIAFADGERLAARAEISFVPVVLQ